MADVVILGGGFGGLAAANELRRLLSDEHAVTLVDRRDTFFMGLAKLWALVGKRPLEEGSRSLEALNRKGITFRRSEVTSIDPENKTVQTTGGELRADFLVIALGAAYAVPPGVDLADPVFNLYDAASLTPVRAGLEDLEEGSVRVAILGIPYKCPPAPYEATFLIHDWLRERGRAEKVALSVDTPQPSPLPVAGPKASREIARRLEERGIALTTEQRAEAIDSKTRSVKFDGGAEAEFDLMLVVPRHVAPKPVAGSALVGESGWIEPDRSTLRTSFDGVYAVGDCTRVPIATGDLPKAGIFAEAEGLVAARNIAAEITGGEVASFDGHGYCFLEYGEGVGSYVQGDFFAEPKPEVEVTDPSEKTVIEKEAFERQRLDAWL